MEEYVWVDAGSTTDYWTIMDGLTWCKHTVAYSQGAASLVDWTQATITSVDTQKENYSAPPLNVNKNTPDEMADMWALAALLDWLYNDWDIHPLDVSLTEVMKHTAIYMDPM